MSPVFEDSVQFQMDEHMKQIESSVAVIRTETIWARELIESVVVEQQVEVIFAQLEECLRAAVSDVKNCDRALELLVTLC